jgi:hypothetical protein
MRRFLCSVGWFEEKLMVVSVVVGFRYMSISRFIAFLIISKSRKLILLLASCVGLSCMSLCIWFMYVMMRSEIVFAVPYIISMSSTYRMYNIMFLLSNNWFIREFARRCRNILAIVFEIFPTDKAEQLVTVRQVNIYGFLHERLHFLN